MISRHLIMAVIPIYYKITIHYLLIATTSTSHYWKSLFYYSGETSVAYQLINLLLYVKRGPWRFTRTGYYRFCAMKNIFTTGLSNFVVFVLMHSGTYLATTVCLPLIDEFWKCFAITHWILSIIGRVSELFNSYFLLENYKWF